VFGVMPLSVATGAGSAARRSMGTGVVGGMLVATFVATLFVPLFFTVFARRRKMGEVEEEDRGALPHDEAGAKGAAE
jgi:HAE1 family hydrophobic/amphiphilic exporter-1/multidrug efflux pump